ncbi:MAG: hypothetical protein RIQ78_84, partial [Bacteroidota bacterium]
MLKRVFLQTTLAFSRSLLLDFVNFVDVCCRKYQRIHMTTIKGPAIFLAQFLGDEAPFNSLEGICRWAAALGYVGVQIPTWDSRLIDLEQAAESKAYCDDLKGRVEACGVQITELSTHLQGQLVA